MEIIILAVFAVTCVAGLAQPKFGDVKIEESYIKQGGTTPVAISSRFLDLGGVISQLFSGFNQGSRGGGGNGLNLPPNSQFYPGVPGKNGYTQPPASQGSDWSFFNQGPGNNPNRGNGYKQQWKQQNQNLFNSNNNLQPPQIHGLRPTLTEGQNFGQHLNNPTSQFTSHGFQNQGSQNSGRQTDVPWHPNKNIGQNSPSSSNEGTLDDFFSTERTYYGDRGDQKLVHQDDDEKNAIWGKQVRVPTVSSDNIVFIDSSETPDQRQCVQNCPTTSEYDPVCGTDGVSYFNTGRLICARNCGIHVFEARQGNCRTKR